jgi:hypothetical protein
MSKAPKKPPAPQAKTKFVLFVGHHKVGSSSLQRFLAVNAGKLLDNGMLYPAIDMKGVLELHTKRRKPVDDGFQPGLNVVEPHNAMAFALFDRSGGPKAPDFVGSLPSPRAMLATMRHQVEVLQPKTTMVVSEVLSRVADVRPELAQRLKRSVPHGEAKVLVTLRDPVQYLPSFHAQLIKLGARVAPLRGRAFDNHFDSVHVGYDRLIEPWVEHFGPEAVDVATYDDVMTAGGSIPDFFARAGLKVPRGLTEVGHVNPSLHLSLNELQRQANHVLAHGEAMQLRDMLVRHIPKADLPPNRDIEMFMGDQRDRLARRFDQIRHRMREALRHDPLNRDWDLLTPAPMTERDAMEEALKVVRAHPRAEALPSKVREFLKDVRFTDED